MSTAISITGAVSAGKSLAPEVRETAGGGFQEALKNAMQGVARSDEIANASVQGFLSGGGQELHSTLLAAQNAQLDFEMFLQVRNKVVSAYEEVMKMQI